MFPSSLPTPRTLPSIEAPPLKWGILGTGWIADQFVGAVRAHTRQVIQAVGSRDRVSADRAAARFGASTAHGSYEALVSDPAVDVVYVATPHNFHLPHALLAIGAGKHVLIEKPVGLDAGEARAIHVAATAAGVFCMEAMWTLFLPKFDVLRQLLADGDVPPALFVSSDRQAIGLLLAMHEAGVRVPDDVAIVGFDGAEDGEYSWPPLTTVAQPIEQMARTAVDLMIDGAGDDVNQVFPPTLLVRRSCGC